MHTPTRTTACPSFEVIDVQHGGGIARSWRPSKQIGPHGSTLGLDVGVTCRTMRDNVELTQANLKTIRKYLLKSFPGLNMTEDTPDPNVCHRFTMTSGKTFQQFRLKVGWSRLSESYNTPEERTDH